jgi:choloylglycine hydrolase
MSRVRTPSAAPFNAIGQNGLWRFFLARFLARVLRVLPLRIARGNVFAPWFATYTFLVVQVFTGIRGLAMKRRTVCLTGLAATLCCLAASHQPLVACTGIRIKPNDGSVIVARTLEFAANLQSSVIVIPRAMESVGTAPGGKRGLRWKSKYAAVGANGFDMPAIVDGLNEKGLGIGIFYFPGYAKYQAVKEEDVGKAVAPWEVPVYLLGSCSNVDEAVQAVRSVRVGEVVQTNMGFAPPCHYIVSDSGGRCVVLEYVGGELKIHDNPLGVITNSPTFDWHVTNLRNYVNLSVNNVPTVDIAGIKLPSFGQGSGMLGLPGDFTPPSRFIRAVAFSQSALPVATAHEGVLQAFHLLNQFDIPKGAARGVDNGKEVADYTLWTSASDLTNHRYYFRTFDSSRIRMIDLAKMNLAAKEIKTISMAGQEVIEDLSSKAH